MVSRVSIFGVILCVLMALPLVAQKSSKLARKQIKPIHERMLPLLDKHYERFDTTASFTGMPERLSSLILTSKNTEHYYYRGEAVDKEGEAYARGFDVTIYHFSAKHEVKSAITALYSVYGVDYVKLHSTASVKKSKAPPFVLEAAGTDLTMITAPCDAFRIKKEMLDFTELVRTLTIKADVVSVNECHGPVFLY